MAIAVHTPTIKIIASDSVISEDLGDLQGTWTTEQYLRLTDSTHRLIEFTDNDLDILPVPTHQHQVILAFLYRTLYPYIERIGGTILFAALRVQIREGKFREPDILLVRDANDPRLQDAYWLGADLVVEIVSPDNPDRDTVTKRTDYAEGHIPEYWIVNPLLDTITVLHLKGDDYAEHGVFQRGEIATSILLDGFAIDVNDVFNSR